MKFKLKVTDSGAYIAAINPVTGEHDLAADVASGQELEISIPDVSSTDRVQFGEVVQSGEQTPSIPAEEEQPPAADTPGAGNEGSPAGDTGQAPAAGSGDGDQGGTGPTDPESPGPDASEVGGEQPPAGEGEGPTTSAASEKPLYKIEGEDVPDGFVASGLETPGDEPLYHFDGDTAGEASTGNRDGVSIYAEADDGDKPVKAAAPVEEAPAS